MVEPLRYEMDRWCWRLVSTQVITAKDFSQTQELCQLQKAGRTRFYQQYEQVIPSIRKKIWQHVRELGRLIEGKPFDLEVTSIRELGDA